VRFRATPSVNAGSRATVQRAVIRERTFDAQRVIVEEAERPARRNPLGSKPRRRGTVIAVRGLMEDRLTKSTASTLVYVALGFALWGAVVGVRAVLAPSSVWTWLVLVGACALMALAALRAYVANDLGAHSRTARIDGGASAAASLSRRVTHLDRSLVAVVGIWVAPLVMALMAGAVER